MKDSNVPQGWDYNPSAWSQRWPIVALSAFGFVMAAYLAMYQYRLINDVFEPFFGDGSRTILDSKLSHALPVSDAALGALAYLADAATGIAGGKSRWRTMPWIVIVFGILVGPLGLVSLGLVIAQPVLYDSWCTLCLLSALISVVMIGPSMDEVLASLQYLKRVRERRRHLFWRVFWGRQEDPDPESGKAKPQRGSIIWTLVLSTVMGIALMALPSVLDWSGPAAMHGYILGPLVIAFAVMAMWDATRPLRWVNAVGGLWLMMAGVLMSFPAPAMFVAILMGAVLIVLSCPSGRIHHATGAGWSALWLDQSRRKQ